MPSTLNHLAKGDCGRVVAIDWDRLSAPEGRRLRELGLIEGAGVELIQRGSLFVRDPIAVRVGRTTVVIRAAHAAAITIAPASVA